MRLATYLHPDRAAACVGVLVNDRLLDVYAAASTEKLVLPGDSLKDLLVNHLADPGLLIEFQAIVAARSHGYDNLRRRQRVRCRTKFEANERLARDSEFAKS